MDEDELEQIIRGLVKRKRHLHFGSAEYQLIQRMLHGLRDNYERASDIWEGEDPNGWGVTLP